MKQPTNKEKTNQVNDYVTVDKFAQMTGLSEEAIRQKTKKGQWVKGVHWHKAPDGRIFIVMDAVNTWIKSSEA